MLKWDQVRACTVLGEGAGQTDPWHYLPLPEGASCAVIVTPGRGVGALEAGDWQRLWGSLQGGSEDSGGHGGSGDSGGHGGTGDSGSHGRIISLDGHGEAGSLDGSGDRAIVAQIIAPSMAPMATRMTGI